MKKTSILILLIILAFSNKTSAVTHIKTELKKENGLKGDINFNLNSRSGSVNKKDYSYFLNLNYRRNNDNFKFLGKKSYGKNNGIKNINETFSHLRYIKEDFYKILNFESFIQYEKNDFKNLSNRKLLGIGLSNRDRIKRFYGNEIEYHLFGGIMYENEKNSVSKSKSNDIRLSFSNNLKYKFDEYPTEIIAYIYFQPLLEDFNDYRTVGEIKMKAEILENIDIGIVFNYKYDSKPFLNIAKTDKTYSTFISYRF